MTFHPYGRLTQEGDHFVEHFYLKEWVGNTSELPNHHNPQGLPNPFNPHDRLAFL